ncbi:MAG: ComEA family DNA-binding protein [Shewanella sp.]
MKNTQRLSAMVSAIALTALLTVPVMAADPVKEASKLQTQTKMEPKVAAEVVKKPSAALAPVNINTASFEELQLLQGIGVAKAKAILDYRTKNGKFTSIDDLGNVSGIGPKLIEQNRHLIKL